MPHTGASVHKDNLAKLYGMEALNLNAVNTVHLDDIGARLYNLVINVPKTGSFKYQDMPTEYKQQFKALLDELLKIPDFAKLQSRYLELADKISDYYGYGKHVPEVVLKDTAENALEAAAENTEASEENADDANIVDSRQKARNDAKEAFEKELGNELLSFIRSYKKELVQSVPKDIDALKSIVKGNVQKLLQNNPKFAELLLCICL